MKSVNTAYLPPIPIDADRDHPLYRQVYEWFRSAILSGQLRPGQAVSSTRSLASHLGISRAPVLVAFELLQAEGYIESSTGAKTRVAGSLPERIARQLADRNLDHTPRPHGSRAIRGEHVEQIWNADAPWLRHAGAFRPGVSDSHVFPNGAWASLLARHAHAREPQTTGSMGYLSLRVAIAEYLLTARDVRCVPEQVMIVNGAQHAMQIAAKVLLREGDAVWMEEPGYPGASGALKSVGAKLVPVPVDDEGLNVTEGIKRSRNAGAAYVAPAHQFPMGCTMSVTRRLMLLDWAARNGAWILEDDYDSVFRFAGPPIASLHSLDADDRVVYIGSFSKVLSPGLRIGYMVIPIDLVPTFRAARQAIDISSPTLIQMALADFMQEGHLARHIARLKRKYARQREVFVAAIRTYIGDDLTIVGTVAGLHLVGLLPAGIDDLRVARKLGEVGISAVPLSTCYLAHKAESGLVLGYGNVDADEIPEATKLLGTILCREVDRVRRRRALTRHTVLSGGVRASASVR